ncbi:MAG: CPBP family intramembrane metalloprotease [Methanobacteriaceae archaeon]|jgi:membrane protease YdiL (CAAX protease family)|nr:CPBP family intramembrane metalloprotease [Candidatus Methanorudis spinitermitis]
MILSEFIDAIINLMFFLLIPLLWWLFAERKKQSFFNWIGLKKPKIKNKKKFWLIFIIVIALFTPISLILDTILPNTVQLASQRFYGQGIRNIIPMLIFSFIKTGLSEEIFFRGFLGKNLSKKFGFTIGNLIQGTIFGLLHGANLYINFGAIISISVTIFTGTLGWFMGYINEKESGGSIVPSWCLHGIANTLSCLFDAFKLVR